MVAISGCDARLWGLNARSDRRWPRAAQAHRGHVYLCAQSTSGTPQSRILAPPFSSRGLLVRANDGAVYQQVLAAPILDQHGKHLLPDPGGGPAREALVHSLVLAVALRQTAPARTREQHPEHAIDEGKFVYATAPRGPMLCRAANPQDVSIDDLSVRSGSGGTCRLISSCLYRLISHARRSECRFSLEQNQPLRVLWVQRPCAPRMRCINVLNLASGD